MFQPCGQGSYRAVGNLPLPEAGRDDKCCILTCCDLNIFPHLCFQNETQSWVITGLVGLLGWISARTHTFEAEEGAENRDFPYYTSVPHFCWFKHL